MNIYIYIYIYKNRLISIYVYIYVYTHINTYTARNPLTGLEYQIEERNLPRKCIYIYTYIYMYIYSKKPPRGSRISKTITNPPREHKIDRQAQRHGGSRRHGGGPREALRRGRGGPHREHQSGAPIGSTNREGRPSFVLPSLRVSLHVSVS